MAISKQALSKSEVASFCDQMSIILKSGISSAEGLIIMLEDCETEDDRVLIEKIIEGRELTKTFAGGLKFSEVFPSYMINMVDIGEETGRLDEVMESLTIHYEREDLNARTIRSAVSYPIVMIGMMVAVIVVLLVKVMPIFNDVFTQLGSEMTGISRILLDLCEGINKYSIALIILVILITLAILFSAFTSKGRKSARKIGYKFKPTRHLFEYENARRFADAMALTIASGLTVDKGIELSENLSYDSYFQSKLNICKEKLAEGNSLSVAVREAEIFDVTSMRMISIAEKTGSLDVTLNKISNIYEEEIDTKLNNTLAILEPTLVVVLSVAMGLILLSVMFPLLGIMSAL